MAEVRLNLERLRILLRQIDRTIASLDRFANQIKLNQNLSETAKKQILDSIEAYKTKLQEKKQKIETIRQRGGEIPTAEIQRDLAELQEANNGLENILSKYKEQLRTEETRNLKDALKEGRTLENEFSGIVRNRNRLEESRNNNQAPQTNQPVSPQFRDSIARNQVLNSTSGKTEITLPSFRTELVISAERILADLARGISVEKLAQDFAKEFKVEASDRFTELISRLFSRLIIDKLIARIAEGVERSAELTQGEVRRIIDTLNAELTRSASEIISKSEPRLRTKKSIEDKEMEKLQEKRDLAQERIGTRIVYDRATNSIRIEISGRAKEPAALKATAELCRTSVKEAVRAVVETASRLIAGTPEAKAETLRLVSEIISQVFTGKPVETPGRSSQPVAAQRIPLFSDSRPAMGSTAPTQDQNVLPTAAEAEAVVRVLVNELRNAPQTQVQQTQTQPQTQPPPQTSSEVIKTVLTSLPEAALPAVVKQYTASTTNDKAALEPLITELVNSKEGERYVLNLFAQNNGEQLTSTEIGKKAVVEVARNIIDRAKAEVKPNAQLPVRDKAQQLLIITSQVVKANEARFEPGRLTVENAKALLAFVTKVDQCFDPIALKNIYRAKRAAQQAQNFTSYGRKTQNNAARRIAQKALKEGRIAERAKAINEMFTAARTANLVIPKRVLESVYAGLAGVNPTLPRTDVPGVYASPHESAVSRNIKNIIAALEVQAGRIEAQSAEAAQIAAAGKNTATVWTRALSIAVQAFLYGTIARLIKGRVATLEELNRIDEVMQELQERGHLGLIVKYLEADDQNNKKGKKEEQDDLATRIEVVTAYLANVIIELDSARELAAAA